MRKYSIGIMTLAAIATLAVAVPALAETNTSTKASINGQYNTNRPTGMMQWSDDQGEQNGLGRGPGMMRPGVIGTVSAVSGNTITVVGRLGFGKSATASTTYTVDATNAKVTRANATSTVSSIVVGDIVAVQGTVTGTNVVATNIRDGIMGGPGIGFGRGEDKSGPKKTGTSTPIIVGNGEPVIAGTISAVSSSTISITNKSNIVYNIDVSNAKIVQGKNTITIATLKTGDAVVVQGTINGTAVVASSVIDQSKPANSNPGNTHPGFLGGIGQFFMHLFGF